MPLIVNKSPESAPFASNLPFIDKQVNSMLQHDRYAPSGYATPKQQHSRSQRHLEALKSAHRSPGTTIDSPRRPRPTSGTFCASVKMSPIMEEPAWSSQHTSPRSEATFAASVPGSACPNAGVTHCDAAIQLTLDSGSSGAAASSIRCPVIKDLMTFAYDHVLPYLWPNDSTHSLGKLPAMSAWDNVAAIANYADHDMIYLALFAALKAMVSCDQEAHLRALVLRRHAIIALNQHDHDKLAVSEGSMKAVLSMFSLETIIGMNGAARRYLKMLRNLVEAYGGIMRIESAFREEMLTCDCYFALKYGTRPLFPSRDWTPGQLNEAWRAQLDYAELSPRSTEKATLLIDFPNLKLILEALRELLVVHNHLVEHKLPFDYQLLQWCCFRRLDCISRLADHYVNVTLYPHQYTLPQVESFCAIAAALMTNIVLGCPEPHNSGRTLMSTLRKHLIFSRTGSGTDRCRRLRLWATYVGSLAERVHPEADAHAGEHWFQTSLGTLAGELEMGSWPEMQAALQQVLYDERLQTEIASGTPCRTSDLFPGLHSPCCISWRLPLSTDPCRFNAA